MDILNKINVVKIFDYEISNKGVIRDVDRAFNMIETGSKGKYMACANPHSIVVASRDQIFHNALQQADILIPDGIGIVLAAKILNLPLKEKVAGSDFFHQFCLQAEKKGGMKSFFLGSSSQVLSRIKLHMKKEFPSINVCGTYSPPFKEVFSNMENNDMINAINKVMPDILWVGMTAPKQEKWIFQNRHHLNVPFIGAIGAVFDFYAEAKKRSSNYWIKIGLEWFPRFLKEPRRLWERNLKSNPIFLWWVLREKLRRMKEK